MSAQWSFLIGLTTMTAVGVGVLAFVHRPFTAVLRELCGEEQRARFWAQLYDASLLLTVVFTAMLFPPDPAATADVFAFLGMWRAGMFGLLLSLGVLALVMLNFIRQHDQRAAEQRRS